MGAALAGGLLASGFVSPSELVIVEVIAARREQLTTMFPGVTISPLITPCGSAVIAVKPPDVPAASQSAVTAGQVACYQLPLVSRSKRLRLRAVLALQ